MSSKTYLIYFTISLSKPLISHFSLSHSIFQQTHCIVWVFPHLAWKADSLLWGKKATWARIFWTVSFQVKTKILAFLTYKLQHAGCCQQGDHAAGVYQHIVPVERAKSHLQSCKGNRSQTETQHWAWGIERVLTYNQTPSLHTFSMASALALYLEQLTRQKTQHGAVTNPLLSFHELNKLFSTPWEL